MSKYIVLFILPIIMGTAHADDFSAALTAVNANCSNISAQLDDLKKMAGINTAVTGVGTAAAAGATVVGVIKANTDKKLAEILAQIPPKTDTTTNPSVEETKQVYNETSTTSATTPDTDKLTKQSVALGNARTGLLGASAATNVAGAVIASKNKTDDDLQAQIDSCVQSVSALESTIGQARADGIDITNAREILSACGKWRDIDLSKINAKSKGAFISSIVGAATGVAGTATSAAANTNNVRNGDETKENNLNMASNVLAGGTAIASGAATVFNATQISTIKKIVAVAQECEEVLK